MLSQSNDHSSIAREFLEKRYEEIRTLAGKNSNAETSIYTEENFGNLSRSAMVGHPGGLGRYPSATAEASIDEIIRTRLETGIHLPRHDYQHIVDGFHDNHTGPKLIDVANTKLQDRVRGMMEDEAVPSDSSIAELLGRLALSRKDKSCSAEARAFLAEYYKIVRNIGAARRVTGVVAKVQRPLDEKELTVAEEHKAGNVGLLRLVDIKKRRVHRHVAERVRTSPYKSVEECLREAVVHQGNFHQKADHLLRTTYESHGISGARVSILQGFGPSSWTLEELEQAIQNPKGFLRPLVALDFIHQASDSVFPAIVISHMQQFPDSSFAEGLLEAAKGSIGEGLAQQCLATFVSVNYVGGKYDVSIHSREGFESLAQPSPATTPDIVLLKLANEGAAALTLDELDTILPEPFGTVSEDIALVKARESKFTENFWRYPEDRLNHVVAHKLVRLIRGGGPPQNARAHLDQSVQAFHGGVHANSYLISDSPPPPPPPPMSFDYGEMARAAASGVSSRSDAAREEEDGYSTGQIDRDDESAEPRVPSMEYESLQKRYFHISDPDSAFHCLCCGEEGHSEECCPALTCQHCGTKDEHFSGACPVNQKCGRCRQRGHYTTQCTALSSSLMRSLNDACDVCGAFDHIEEECTGLWYTTLGHGDTKVLVPQHYIHVNCYNCGENSQTSYASHWGDDCPRMGRDTRVRNLNPTFSKKHADKFILSSLSEHQPQTVGFGSIPRHQLALLDD